MNKNVKKNLETIKNMYKPRDEEEEKGPGLLFETTREKVVRKQKERKEKQKGRRRQLNRQMEQGRDDKIAKASLKNPIVVKSPPKVTSIKSQKKTKTTEVNKDNKAFKQKSTPEKKGSEFKAYPGAAGRAGFEYGRDTAEILDDKNISEEIKERLEEEELYEGDFMGGRVGKGKKKKVSEAPRGVRAALRGFKPKIGVGKGNKRTRGTGGGWV